MDAFRNKILGEIVPAEFSDKFQVLMLQVVNFDINTLSGLVADEGTHLAGDEDNAE